MIKRIRVVQVGVGNFGAKRRQIMRDTGLFELIAAYDINPSALDKCCQEEGISAASSYESLLATPSAEAVVISTGAIFHAEQIVLAMRRGLHVFVEKPICSNAADLREILQLQRETGLIVGVGHCDHSSNMHSQQIKQLVDSGELGKIVSFEITTAHSGGFQIKPGDRRGVPMANPGGMLFQCGIHGIHELRYYFGEIQSVYCSMRYDLHDTATADVALCQLYFKSGLIGALNCYHVTPYRHSFHIFGTKANLYRDDRRFDEGTRILLQSLSQPGAKEELVPVILTEAATAEGGGMRSFYRSISYGEACYPSLLDGAKALTVVLAAEESSRTGMVVSCDMN